MQVRAKPRPSDERESVTRYIRDRLRREAEENGRGYLARVARETGFTPTHVSKVAGGSGSVGYDFSDAMAKFWGFQSSAALQLLAVAPTVSSPRGRGQIQQALREQRLPIRNASDGFDVRHRAVLAMAEASDFPDLFVQRWLGDVDAMRPKLRESVSAGELWMLCQSDYLRWKSEQG